MVTSIILMNVKRTKIADVAKALADMDGFSEVYSVSGNYDLIAIARVASNEALATLVTEKLRDIEDIVHTETMLAFKAFSKHDLESMFSVGNA
ncbi:MAG: Lrp/AsnC ligand binding domain-containing protein [Gammaproteobacteria bacterium]|nr:Lrp/AsnC ligand binding domain-containing protein [Gammaproteobacteria bacterium]